ncbi:hypothetical protein C0992_004220 [Termitomyces sp. T32_za158]|nr:hypothetical protein C0992_004220 [Termitomyces sp. T32_za158]
MQFLSAALIGGKKSSTETPLPLKSYDFDPLILPPSTLAKPIAYRNWFANNDLARAIILTALDDSEYDGLDEAKTAANLYTQVKACAEGEGLVQMIALI